MKEKEQDKRILDKQGPKPKEEPVDGGYGAIDLGSEKIQPFRLAQFYADVLFHWTVTDLKLKCTPEMIQELEDTFDQKRKIMEQGKVNLKELGETYITI